MHEGWFHARLARGRRRDLFLPRRRKGTKNILHEKPIVSFQNSRFYPEVSGQAILHFTFSEPRIHELILPRRRRESRGFAEGLEENVCCFWFFFVWGFIQHPVSSIQHLAYPASSIQYIQYPHTQKKNTSILR